LVFVEKKSIRAIAASIPSLGRRMFKTLAFILGFTLAIFGTTSKKYRQEAQKISKARECFVNYSNLT
jgi:hypothetical protein